MTQQYTRLKTVPIAEVMPLIMKHIDVKGKRKAREEVAGTVVKVTGLRLQTFATKGCTCSSCGLVASHFAIESNSDSKNSWHLNLWGVKDGEEILFTHDHTIARGDGGADDETNVTTMCSPCNAAKGLLEIAARRI
jgi:5-methylcytosine-specific restriction endonuclease McrA